MSNYTQGDGVMRFFLGLAVFAAVLTVMLLVVFVLMP